MYFIVNQNDPFILVGLSRILQGGVATGLSHVVEDTTPKLFAVKGKRQVVVTQKPKVEWSEMNTGDCFVLNVDTTFFIWMGRSSNRLERLQASKVGNRFVFIKFDLKLNVVLLKTSVGPKVERGKGQR